jgi:dCMP deaminase
VDDKYFLRIANEIGKKGRCARRDIGVVLVDKNEKIVSTGFNGTPFALPNCKVKACPDAEVPAGEGTATRCHGVHGEIRAILDCKDIKEIHTMYTTKAPCLGCTMALLETPCKRIVFSIPYKKPNGEEDAWKAAGREWLDAS